MYQKILSLARSRVAKRSGGGVLSRVRRRSSPRRRCPRGRRSSPSRGRSPTAWRRRRRRGSCTENRDRNAPRRRRLPRRGRDGHPERVEHKLALRSSRIDQPMILRLNTSWTTERNRNPCPVWMTSSRRPRAGLVPRGRSHGRRDPARSRAWGRGRSSWGRLVTGGSADPELAHQPGDALLADPDAIAELELRVDPGAP